jgi:hypothetical protein
LTIAIASDTLPAAPLRLTKALRASTAALG